MARKIKGKFEWQGQQAELQFIVYPLGEDSDMGCFVAKNPQELWEAMCPQERAGGAL